MPHHQHLEIEGKIADVFAHRFTIERADGTRILADLGPKGAEAFELTPGLAIVAFGEMRPSELKVDRIAKKGGAPIEIERKHGPGHHGPHHDHGPGDSAVALRAVTAAGFRPLGEPRRKPKHFEVLASKGRSFVECHVEFDGHIRKEKPVPRDDHKWAHELGAAA